MAPAVTHTMSKAIVGLIAAIVVSVFVAPLGALTLLENEEVALKEFSAHYSKFYQGIADNVVCQEEHFLRQDHEYKADLAVKCIAGRLRESTELLEFLKIYHEAELTTHSACEAKARLLKFEQDYPPYKFMKLEGEAPKAYDPGIYFECIQRRYEPIGEALSNRTLSLFEMFARDFNIEMPILSGMGRSIDDPIVFYRETPSNCVELEIQIIKLIAIERGITWTPLERATLVVGDRKLDKLTIEVRQYPIASSPPATEDYYFNVTAC